MHTKDVSVLSQRRPMASFIFTSILRIRSLTTQKLNLSASVRRISYLLTRPTNTTTTTMMMMVVKVIGQTTTVAVFMRGHFFLTMNVTPAAIIVITTSQIARTISMSRQTPVRLSLHLLCWRSNIMPVFSSPLYHFLSPFLTGVAQNPLLFRLLFQPLSPRKQQK